MRHGDDVLVCHMSETRSALGGQKTWRSGFPAHAAGTPAHASVESG